MIRAVTDRLRFGWNNDGIQPKPNIFRQSLRRPPQSDTTRSRRALGICKVESTRQGRTSLPHLSLIARSRPMMVPFLKLNAFTVAVGHPDSHFEQNAGRVHVKAS